MKTIVQKFGGTSLATASAREAAIARVLAARDSGLTPVVVASAMGRRGDPYATDTLIDLLPQGVCRREQDLVMACGEVIAAGVLAGLLRQHLDDVTVLTGWQAGIITDDRHGDARILDVHAGKLQQLLADGQTVVVAGFQGMSEQGEITTLGRGGSDTTAVALGVALGAAMVEIYTDVDGVLTADPRLVPEAVLVEQLSYADVLQLATAGAKVLHPRAVELAMQHGVRLVVRHASGDRSGTVICRTNGYEHRRTLPAGIACKTELVQVALHPTDSSEQLLHRLSSAGVEATLVDLGRERQRFTLPAHQLQPALAALGDGCSQLAVRQDCALVTVVGVNPWQRAQALLTMARTLAEVGTDMLQTSDAEQSVSALIDQSHLPAAASALHHAFGLGGAGVLSVHPGAIHVTMG